MGKVIFVLGPQGVGKTALLEVATRKLSQKFRLLNYGEFVGSIVKTDRDAYRRTASIKDFAKVQKKAAQEIAKLAKKENLLVTSHAVLWREAGFYPGFPEWVLKSLRPDLIILVRGEPQDIIARKLRDKLHLKETDRTRDEIPMEMILQEQEAGRYISYAYSVLTGCPVKEVVNHEGEIQTTAEEVVKAINNL